MLKSLEELSVNEFDRVNLSCPVNLQGDLGDLNIEWRNSDLVLRTAKANRVQDAFHYVVPFANRNDAGMHKCIVFSTIYGNMMADSLQKILHVKCKSHSSNLCASSEFRVCSWSSSENRVKYRSFHRCSRSAQRQLANGYPPPDVVLSHNNKQINDTDGSLKIVSATERDAGTYCCNASNALGRSNETCLTLDINCKYKFLITLFY